MTCAIEDRECVDMHLLWKVVVVVNESWLEVGGLDGSETGKSKDRVRMSMRLP